jgi:hypothetical protein
LAILNDFITTMGRIDQIVSSAAANDDTMMPDPTAQRASSLGGAAGSTTVPPDAVCAGIPVHRPVGALAGETAINQGEELANQNDDGEGTLPIIPAAAVTEPPNPTRGHAGIGDVPKAPEMGAGAVAEGFFVAPASHIEDIAAGRACAADFEGEPAAPATFNTPSDTVAAAVDGGKSSGGSAGAIPAAGPFAYGIGKPPISKVLAGSVHEAPEYVDAEGKDYALTEEDRAQLDPYIGARPIAEQMSGAKKPPIAGNAASTGEQPLPASAAASRPPPPQVLPAAAATAEAAEPSKTEEASTSESAAHAEEPKFVYAPEKTDPKRKHRGLGRRLLSTVKKGAHTLARPFGHGKNHHHTGKKTAATEAHSTTARPFGRDEPTHLPVAPNVESRRAAAKHDPFAAQSGKAKGPVHASG